MMPYRRVLPYLAPPAINVSAPQGGGGGMPQGSIATSDRPPQQQQQSPLGGMNGLGGGLGAALMQQNAAKAGYMNLPSSMFSLGGAGGGLAASPSTYAPMAGGLLDTAALGNIASTSPEAAAYMMGGEGLLQSAMLGGALDAGSAAGIGSLAGGSLGAGLFDLGLLGGAGGAGLLSAGAWTMPEWLPALAVML